MPIIWGTKLWQFVTAIAIIFIFGYGTYTVLMDVFTGHPIWWYNASLPVFALTILGLLLLVRQGWKALGNIVKHGFHPSSTKPPVEEDTSIPSDFVDDDNVHDSEMKADQE